MKYCSVIHTVLMVFLHATYPLDWIARITSHIPKKGAKQVIYGSF